MKKGDIILNEWASKDNPCRIAIITYIGRTLTDMLYLYNGNLGNCKVGTRELKTDKEHYKIIGHLDYEKVIRDKLRELKRSDNNVE